MDYLPMSGADMRTTRLRMCLTQTEFAQALGCSREYICRLERKRVIPKIVTLAVLYAAHMRNADLRAVDDAA